MTEVNLVDLTKKVDLFKRKMNQLNIHDLICDLTVVLDVSGSMRDSYRKGGYMDQLMKRFIAFASIVDPNKTVEVYAFDSRVYALPDMKVEQYDNYLDIVRESDQYWKSTAYDVAFDAIRNAGENVIKKALGVFGFAFKKPKPKFVVFFTDGSPDSITDARDALYRLNGTNTYIQFIAVGPRREFAFIEQQANQLDYVGFVHFASMHSVTDEEFTEQFLHQESLSWIKEQMK